MILYLVRHGEPDYTTDTLLPSGWKQAELVAERLATGGIDKIYSSPMGRARETASPLAYKLALPVHIKEWASELDHSTYTDHPDGERKTVARLSPSYVNGEDFRRYTTDEAFENIRGMDQPGLKKKYYVLAEGIDDLLRYEGYRREKDGTYFKEAPNDRHIVLFCHAAMQRLLISHMLNIPLQMLSSTLATTFTGVTVLMFADKMSDHITPRLISYGDVGHLYAAGMKMKCPFETENF